MELNGKRRIMWKVIGEDQKKKQLRFYSGDGGEYDEQVGM